MRKYVAILTLMIGLIGCNGQDVATVGRIGHKVQARLVGVFGDDPDAVMKTLPLVPPAGTGKKWISPVESPRPIQD